MRRVLPFLSLIGAAVVASACGVGGAAAIAAGSGGGGGGGGGTARAPSPPRVTLTAPSDDPASSYISFAYVLADPRVKDSGDPATDEDPRVEVFPEYQLRTGPGKQDGGEWLPMTEAAIVGSDGTRGLSLGDHAFAWNTLVDLPRYSGAVRARLRAEYEPTAGLKRKFRIREVELNIDNDLAGTIFGGTVVSRSELDDTTFPVDLATDGDTVLIASVGGGIVERVDALGRVERVIGVGLPGATGDGGDPGAARLEALSSLAVDPATGLIYTDHAGTVRVSNESLVPAPLGFPDSGTVLPGGLLPGRTILTGVTGLNSSSGVRAHPSGAILILDGLARILALNPQPAGSPDIELAGVVIPAGSLGQIAGGGTSDADGTPATQALLSDAFSIAVGPDGEIYYGELGGVNGRVRVINAGAAPLVLPSQTVDPGTVSTVVGDLTSGDPLGLPRSITVSPEREVFVLGGGTSSQEPLVIDLVNLGTTDTTFAGTAVASGDRAQVVGGGGAAVGDSALNISLAGETGIANAITLGVNRTLLVTLGSSVILVNGSDDTQTRYGQTSLPGFTRTIYDTRLRGGLPLVEPSACHSRGPDEVFFADRSTIRVLNLSTEGTVYGGTPVEPGEVGAIAGVPVPGFDGDLGPSRGALFDRPTALATDGPSKLFVADTGNDRIRFINILDPVFENPVEPLEAFGTAIRAGFVDTMVGGGPPGQPDEGDGLGPKQARLNAPQGLAVFGELLFIADTGNQRIRCVNGSALDTFVVAGTPVAPGTIETVYGNGIAGFTADGPGPWFTDTPTALQVDPLGILYISETGNHRIRALNLGLTQPALDGVVRAGVPIAANEVATLVGTGTAGNFGDGGGGPDALIDAPSSLFVQTNAGSPVALYFADAPQHVIRVLNLTDVPIQLTGETLPGTGITSLAGGPNAIGVPNAPAFQGDGGPASDMRFDTPFGIAITNLEGRPAHFLVTDQGNNRLRRFGAPPIFTE